MRLSILIAKITAFILRFMKRGATSLPGRVALSLNSDILSVLSRGVKIICVTGTNGKTTTCALIAYALKENGYSYFINGSGANMLSGVTASFIENSTLSGRCKKEFAILECDENSLPAISRYIDAEIVAVTNIFRDQLDRYGEISHTLAAIKEGIKNMPDAKLLLNADDPVSYSLSALENEVSTFGVNADFKTPSVSDGLYCPLCRGRLFYTSKTLAQLGSFRCVKCGYRRRTPDFEISDVSDGCFTLCGELLSTSLGGVYNLYNFCAAGAVLKLIGIPQIKSLCGFSGAFGRMERFSNNGHTVLLLLVKNPVGLSGCIRYICSVKGELDTAFALNDNDADGTDVSWIWDSDFTPILRKGCKTYSLGKRSLDMALRLKYDGISPTVIENENYSELIRIIKESDCDFAVFSTYTAMMKMRHLFISEFGGKEFWKTE